MPTRNRRTFAAWALVVLAVSLATWTVLPFDSAWLAPALFAAGIAAAVEIAQTMPQRTPEQEDADRLVRGVEWSGRIASHRFALPILACACVLLSGAIAFALSAPMPRAIAHRLSIDRRLYDFYGTHRAQRIAELKACGVTPTFASDSDLPMRDASFQRRLTNDPNFVAALSAQAVWNGVTRATPPPSWGIAGR